MPKRSIGLGIALSVFNSSFVFAHPGHGKPAIEPTGWLHYATEPVHIMMFIALSALAFFAIRAVLRLSNRGYSSGRQM